MSTAFTESVVAQTALDWLAGLGWQTAFGPESVESERGGDFGRVATRKPAAAGAPALNPNVLPGALEEAFHKLTRPDLPPLLPQ
jgi:type I restriction enzyme R subunit